MAMWGRKEPEENRPPAPGVPAPSAAQTRETGAARPSETVTSPASPSQPAASTPMRGTGMDQQQRRAIIGPSIQVKGELVGNEDLIVEGKVEGVVRLPDNQLTVGKTAECQARLEAKAIRIEGTVRGDVKATDRVELAAGSTLIGDIVAPRIAISDGARFKGSVDMDHGRSGAASAATTTTVAHHPTPTAGPGPATTAPQPVPAGAGPGGDRKP